MADLVKELQDVRKISAASILRSLTELAPTAVKFKSDLLNDTTAPDYLRLANANDILDRTLPKPTQQVSLSANVVQANMTDRELKEILTQRLTSIGINLPHE